MGGAGCGGGGGYGGDRVIAGSSVGAVNANGGVGGGAVGGYGGTVTITNSTTDDVSTAGGDSSGGGLGSNGGPLTTTDSTTGNIVTSGGSGPSYGGDAAVVTVGIGCRRHYVERRGERWRWCPDDLDDAATVGTLSCLGFFPTGLRVDLPRSRRRSANAGDVAT
jgi:hypothetical protein